MRILSLIAALLIGITVSAETITGGPWNTYFGESTALTYSKLSTALKVDIQRDGDQINILEPIKVADETFDSGVFFCANDRGVSNHFCGAMFSKTIAYENAFSTHLDFREAERWLINNRYKVTQITTALKKTISSKYGYPFKDTDNEVMWRDNHGNQIVVSIERETNYVQDESFTRQYGAVPCYYIVLIYAENSGLANF
jgi:hypothetical protein